jgi:hypothetical protein
MSKANVHSDCITTFGNQMTAEEARLDEYIKVDEKGWLMPSVSSSSSHICQGRL